MPSIFGNHMILQQDAPLPVWGVAEAGEKVTVTIGQDTATTTAGTDGKWRVTLSPLAATSTPLTFTVAGKNTLTFTDVLVGEVWFASGQSNMALTVKQTKDAATDIPQANDTQLRVFHVSGNSTMEPSDNLSVGTWVLTTPDTVPIYAAVAYYFAKDLRAKLNRPVAIIQCAVGATTAEAWTPLDALKKSPDLKKYVDSYDKVEATYGTLNAAYPAAIAAYRKDLDQWNNEVGVTFTPLMTDWKAAADKAQAAGEPVPPQPVPSRPMPPRPPSPTGPGNTPSLLYNGLVAPVTPYAIRGVIWYQGEFNAATWDTYHSLLSTMITGWRDHWGEGDFPFLIVQLPRFQGGDWQLVREAQSQTTTLPNVNIATTIDLGDPHNLHPTDKADVAHRLALVARHTVYDEKDLVWTGPIYDTMKVEENSIRLSFTQTGSGLTIGSSPWVPPHSTAIPTTSLFGFSVADDQQHWFPAEAKIDGNTVLVSSSQAPHPVAVRYAWQSSPEANLYNKEGLAAAPFRTDDWTDGRDTPSTAATPKPAPVPAPIPSTNAAPVAP
jgi:sialate O-acetylesterase